MRWLIHYLRTSEGVILITTLLLCAAIGLANPVFLSAANLLDLVRDSITTGIFALAVYVALLSGGIDVSFTAVAATAMYGTVKLFVLTNPHAPFNLFSRRGNRSHLGFHQRPFDRDISAANLDCNVGNVELFPRLPAHFPW
jgi:ribose/xylose/arabinose/galactoside ABC-type transport system permease subunit